jgi:hypothetical protein
VPAIESETQFHLRQSNKFFVSATPNVIAAPDCVGTVILLIGAGMAGGAADGDNMLLK